METTRRNKIVHVPLSDDQQDILDHVLSGLLPHEGFSPHAASALVRELQRILPSEEVYGVTYLFYRILKNMDLIGLSVDGYRRKLSRDVFLYAVQYGLRSIITTAEFDAPLFFHGYNAEYDLSIEEQLKQACSAVYTICGDTYDRLIEMAVPTEEASTYIIPLRESLKTSVVTRYLQLSALALSGTIHYGFRDYAGPDGAANFLKVAQLEITRRFSQASENKTNEVLVLDEINAVRKYKADNRIVRQPLFDLGYEPIDKLLTFVTTDIASLVADEGVGKTRLVVDWVHRAIVSGVSTMVICGETLIADFMDMLLGNHVHFRHSGHTFTIEELRDPSKIPGKSLEDLEAYSIEISESETDLYSNPTYGRLVLIQNTNYEDFSDLVAEMAQVHNIQLVVVDHVAALHSNGALTSEGYLNNTKKKIDYLYMAQKDLVHMYNLMFLNTVHLRTDASQRLLKGEEIGVRVGSESSASSKDASIVMLLRTTPDLKKNKIVLLDWIKTRNIEDPPTIALYRNATACVHEYRSKLQHFVTGTKEDISAARLDDLIGPSKTKFASNDYEEDEDDDGVDAL